MVIFAFAAGHRKVRIQPNSNIFCRISLNSKWIHFSEKYLGVKCTLIIVSLSDDRGMIKRKDEED